MKDSDREAVLEALAHASKVDGKVPSLKVVDSLRFRVHRFLAELPTTMTIIEAIDALENPIQLTEFTGVEK